MITSTQPFVLDSLAYAIQLADKLARVDKRPAYVINQDGHPHLASSGDIGLYWTADQIVYVAGDDTPPGNDCPDHGPYADDDCPKC